MAVVVEQDLIAVALLGDKPAVAPAQQRVAKLPQQCESIIACLGDAVCREKPQPTEEELFRLRRLTHPVGERPVTEAVKLIIVFQYSFDDIAGLEAGVIQKILLAGRVVPLGEINGTILCGETFALT